MLSAMLLAATLAGIQPEPLDCAIEHYHTVESYRVTIHSTHTDGEEYIRYYYRKPGYVRIEFIRPHDGAVLIYNPLTQRAHLWPFGTGHFPELNLSPGNPLIRSSRGQQVDRSDVGALFENIRTLGEGGNTTISGEESLDGQPALHLIVTGADRFAVAGVHSYELWLDTAHQFPLKVISRDQQGAVIETVVMKDMEINLALPDTLFNPK